MFDFDQQLSITTVNGYCHPEHISVCMLDKSVASKFFLSGESDQKTKNKKLLEFGRLR